MLGIGCIKTHAAAGTVIRPKYKGSDLCRFLILTLCLGRTNKMSAACPTTTKSVCVCGQMSLFELAEGWVCPKCVEDEANRIEEQSKQYEDQWIKEFACCERATRINGCVCMYAYTCPDHGTKHVGTHD